MASCRPQTLKKIWEQVRNSEAHCRACPGSYPLYSYLLQIHSGLLGLGEREGELKGLGGLAEVEINVLPLGASQKAGILEASF